MHERTILVILIVFTSCCFTTYSQNYTKDIVRLWDKKNIPFNKGNIKLKETVDSTGRRYTQISDPVLYIYRKKGGSIASCETHRQQPQVHQDQDF